LSGVEQLFLLQAQAVFNPHFLVCPIRSKLEETSAFLHVWFDFVHGLEQNFLLLTPVRTPLCDSSLKDLPLQIINALGSGCKFNVSFAVNRLLRSFSKWQADKDVGPIENWLGTPIIRRQASHDWALGACQFH
jgi:hypothetical protein